MAGPRRGLVASDVVDGLPVALSELGEPAGGPPVRAAVPGGDPGARPRGER